MDLSNSKTTPHFEHLFLKRNALFSISIAMIVVGLIASEYSKNVYNDSGWIAFSIGCGVGISLVFLFVALIRIIKIIPKAKNAWMYGNYQDEYFNHLNHRAYKYAFNTTVVVAAFLSFGYASSIMPSWLADHDGALILMTLLLSFGIPILVWLRGDNE